MEINNIFADKMVQLSWAIFAPIMIEVDILLIAKMLKRRHIADWRIQPDLKIFARRIGDFKAKIGRIATDIPLLKTGFKPFPQLVGNLILNSATARPGF